MESAAPLSVPRRVEPSLSSALYTAENTAFNNLLGGGPAGQRIKDPDSILNLPSPLWALFFAPGRFLGALGRFWGASWAHFGLSCAFLGCLLVFLAVFLPFGTGPDSILEGLGSIWGRF